MVSPPPLRKLAATASGRTDAHWFEDYDVVGVSGYAPQPADGVRQQETVAWLDDDVFLARGGLRVVVDDIPFRLRRRRRPPKS